MDLNELFHTYGPQYFPYVVLACATVENDVTFIMAGVYVASIHHHSLDLSLGILAGTVGALIHDSIWFWLGKKNSAWMRNTAAWKRLGPQIETWATRFGWKELFLSRFLPGTRNASTVFWGINRMPAWAFYAIETAGLLVWGTLLTLLGFFFGNQAQAVMGKVHRAHLGRWLLLSLIVVAVVYFSIRAFTKHRIVTHGQPPPDPRQD